MVHFPCLSCIGHVGWVGGPPPLMPEGAVKGAAPGGFWLPGICVAPGGPGALNGGDHPAAIAAFMAA